MRRTTRLLLVLALASLSALPANAEIVPTLRSEQVYFHCSGDTKLANATYADSSVVPTWDTTAPTGSVTGGAGCGWADVSPLRNTQSEGLADGVWKGYFTGNLDSLTVQVHAIGVGPGRAGSNQTVRATLFIDGESVFGTDASGNAGRRDVVMKPVVSSTQASALYEFTITGLGLLTEDGEGTLEREIALTLATASEPAQGWVYDTTEVPSGIVFNPATPAAVTIAK